MFTYYVEIEPKVYSRRYILEKFIVTNEIPKIKDNSKDRELEAIWQDCFNYGKHYIYKGDCVRESDKAFIKTNKKGGFLLCLK